MPAFLYPPPPLVSDTSFLEPSVDFKASTRGVISRIISFILLYLGLIVFAIILMVFCALAALFLVTALNTVAIAYIFAFGMAWLGVMFFSFLVKFMFAASPKLQRMEIEITKSDEPELFDFIYRLSKEVGCAFPRKIHLIPDANAGVSYRSSFWSMFLPVRKDLYIGLGLVNDVSLSEFKATMAHEFGHFTQRSMKAGSYVYTMNNVIYNLAYQRGRFDEVIESWSGYGWGLGGFATFTGAFVEVARRMLRASYLKLNLAYLSMSREMEYHADLVACSAAGSNAMLNVIGKLERSEWSYQSAFSFAYTLMYRKSRKVDDIYSIQSKVVPKWKEQPQLNSRVKIKDLWTTHPSKEDREKNIKQSNIDAQLVSESAWLLFKDPETLRKKMTALLFAGSQGLDAFTDVEIDTHLEMEEQRAKVPSIFEDLYYNRVISELDVEMIIELNTETIEERTPKKFKDLVNANTARMIKDYHRDQLDRLKVCSIDNSVESFEFDGKMYDAADAPTIEAQLNNAIAKREIIIKELDEDIFRYYRQRAIETGSENEFVGLYKELHARRQDEREFVELYLTYSDLDRQLAGDIEWSEEQMRGIVHRICALEKKLKKAMRGFSPQLVENCFENPEEVLEYLDGWNFWNRSDKPFNHEGFNKLRSYVTGIAASAQAATWNATQEIFKKQEQLSPLE